ncbi:hypothetical protein ABZX12_18645 [Kribbella sp. NPDC003505]|uniref:hypothetical protein n=1 Tax=Kribbella sp. NPDC003505 TaxID=3154448 RepID=UPI0033B2B5CD
MSVPVSQSRPVLILGGIAAGSLVLSNGLPPLTPEQFDWIGPAIGLLGLTITAVVTFITQGKVTPLVDPRDEAGRKLVPLRTGGPVSAGGPALLGDRGREYISTDGVPPTDPTTTTGD